MKDWARLVQYVKDPLTQYFASIPMTGAIIIIVRSVKANCIMCSQNFAVDKFGILDGTVMGSCTVNAMVGYAINLANEKEKEYRDRYGETELLFMRLCV